ncbi:secretion protein HlyD family protein (plasmid) [Leptolyngbya sp. NIES-3755]|nr:secretion protein HlyD family protein [Leptolyngbya sp. NIES-3755]
MTHSPPQPQERTVPPLEEQSPSQSPASKPLSKPSRKPYRLIGIGIAIATAGLSAWYFLSRPKTNDLQISGRIEGYETDIGAKVPGRIAAVAVREGDAVKAGQLIVRLNDEEIQAQRRGLQTRLTVAQQQERQARLQIQVVDTQIQEAQLTLEQSQDEQQGRVFQAQSTVAAAEAQLKQSQSQLKLARVDRDRFAQLVKEGATPKQRFDQAQTAYETAQSAVEASQKQVDAARGGLVLAKTSSFNPGIRNARLAGLLQQRQQATAQLQAAQADVKNAQAAIQQIQAQIAYLNVVSPIDGVVTARSVEPGAVVVSGKTLLSIVNLNTVYLRGYVPEGSIGKVRVGQAAKIFLDSNPGQPLTGSVAAIDPQASFTPENIYFKDDRVKQVFGIKLKIDNPAGFVKPGMPADGEIMLETQ